MADGAAVTAGAHRHRPLSLLAISPVGTAGGAEAHLLTLLAGLRLRNVDVHLLCHGNGPLLEEARERGVPAAPAPFLSLRRPATVARGITACHAAIAGRRPDVIVTSHVKAQLIARLASPWARPAHLVLLYDPPDPRRIPDRISAWLPTTRIAIAPEVRDGYRAFRRSLSIQVIEPGVDGAALRHRAATGSPARAWSAAGLAYEPSIPRLLMVARMQRQKGALDLVAAVDRLRDAGPVRCLIVGPDEAVEPGFRERLKLEVERRGLGEMVGIGDRLPGEDLAAVMADATLLVHPAHSEPFGLVVAEALVLGTPVVAYAAAGPRRTLSRGGGDLVPVADIGALVRALRSALTDEALRTRWCHEAVAAGPSFDASASVEAFHGALLGVLSRARR